MRLSKYVKINGNYTEHEARTLYTENRIKVNNKMVDYSWIINENDIVTVDDKILTKQDLVYYLYYKPIGIRCDITSTNDSYISNIKISQKVMPAGRLDKNSFGLVILTNDGNYINYLNNPLNNITKDYIVTLKNKVTDEFLNSITKPIIIKGKLTKEMKVELIDDYNIKLTLIDGKYHQIRRSVINSKNRVISLQRIRIGDYVLDGLKPGEIKEIKKTLINS